MEVLIIFLSVYLLGWAVAFLATFLYVHIDTARRAQVSVLRWCWCMDDMCKLQQNAVLSWAGVYFILKLALKKATISKR